jgi:hypothetical protein
MATVVLPQRLKHDPAGDAVCDAGLNHDLGPRVQRHAPHGMAQRTVPVGVPAIGVAPEAPAPGFQHQPDILHYRIEPLILRARPGRAQQLVQVLIPRLIRHEYRVFPAFVQLVPLANFPWKSSAYHDRISSERARQAHELLQARPPPCHCSTIPAKL